MKLFLAIIAGITLVVAACADDAEEAVPEQTISATPSLASVTPTSSQVFTPTPITSPVPSATAPGTTLAPAEPCTAEENVYSDADARFAFCYPKGGEISEAQTSVGTAVNLRYLSGDIDVGMIFGLDTQPYALCGAIQNDYAEERNRRHEGLLVGGQETTVCRRDFYELGSDTLIYSAIDFSYSSELGKTVIVYAGYSGADSQLTSEQIVLDILKRTETR